MAKIRFHNGSEWEVAGTDADKVELKDNNDLFQANNVEDALVEIKQDFDTHKAECAVLLPKAGSTANDILLDIVLTDKKKGSFRATANNTGDMTINGKAFKRDVETEIPADGVKAGKVYDFYYDATTDCVFILAKASGNAQPSDVLAGKTFSNDDGEQVGTLNVTEIQGAMAQTVLSESHGANVNVLITDGNYLYIGGNPKTIWKLNPDDLSKVAESANLGGIVNAAASDGSYLYVGCNPVNTVMKLNPSTFAKVAESINYGGNIGCIIFEGDYVYVSGSTTQKVWKLNASNLSKVAESIDYGGFLGHMIFCNGYLYVGGATTNKVWKIDPSTMAKVAESATISPISDFSQDGTYLYVAGPGKKVYKLNLSDLTTVSTSDSYGSGTNVTVDAVAHDGEYLYMGGTGIETNASQVWKLNPASMAKLGFIITSGPISALLSFNRYVYAVVRYVVWKILPKVYDKEV